MLKNLTLIQDVGTFRFTIYVRASNVYLTFDLKDTILAVYFKTKIKFFKILHPRLFVFTSKLSGRIIHFHCPPSILALKWSPVFTQFVVQHRLQNYNMSSGRFG